MFDFKYIQKQYYKLGSFIKKATIPVGETTIDMDGENLPYTFGTYFGHKDRYYTIHTEIDFPKVANNEYISVEAFSSLTEWDNSTNPQLKLFLNDTLIQGLDVNHRSSKIPTHYDGQSVAVRLEIYSGREEKQFPMYIQAYVIDQLTYDTYWDLKIVVESWQSVEKATTKMLYQQTLLEAIQLLDFRMPYSEQYYERLTAVRQLLSERIFNQTNDALPVDVYAIGHTHIDLAWLWTFSQATEKAERSFASLLKLMDDYPDFTFIQSQPQLYAFVKERYPELYQKIMQRVADKRWFPEGAMWVESDTNLISGEAMVRQFLYGKQFFKETFNIDSKIVWLPDVFGYSPALPQIMKKTNTPYFMTTKLSWNQYNQIPNDSFVWKGMDGSEVLVHFIPTVSVGYSPTPFYTTYNGMLDPQTVKKSWDRYINKDKNHFIMNAFGYGDGGGGPTVEMLESAKRLEQGLPEMPKVIHSTATDFFERLEREHQMAPLNKWVGELYFEYHRGTYTSIGKIKRNNRKAEFALQNVEKLNYLFNRTHYPKVALERLWKQVLKHQFHDVLPGSSIQEVYDEADVEFAQIFAELGQLQKMPMQKANSSKVLVTNLNGVAHHGYIEVPNIDAHLVTEHGEQLLTQHLTNGQTLVYIDALQPFESMTMEYVDNQSIASTSAFTFSMAERTLMTPFYHIQFDHHFEIVSLYDCRAKRELVVTNGKLNELVVYEDIPMDYDAWDIDYYYKNKRWSVEQLTDVRIKEQGALMFSLVMTRTYQQSTIEQEVIFYAQSPRIDFKTKVDWQEKQQLLRSEFAVDIHAYHYTSDIQFGNIVRPLHQNTSWEKAKFETCAHKWIDISENSYGCALLSDCKYGYNAEYQKMGISLIKSPINPYPSADMGEHHFTYSLLPHQDTWQDASVIEESFALNNPLHWQLVVPHYQAESAPLTVETSSVIIDTIKLAEDESGWIIRLFEAKGRRETVKITLNTTITTLVKCNLLEETEEIITLLANNSAELLIHPYEIITLKIK